jgi:hypothetical protein
MDELNHFARVFKCVVIATLAPVIFTAFVCIPVALERHPGERTDMTASATTQTPKV